MPDPVVGDQVMAAVQLRPGLDALDGAELLAFLAAQGDLGTKWAPRFVRMSAALPATATNKVLKRALRAERWNCAEPVLWQPEKGGPYRLLDAEDAPRSRPPWATGPSESEPARTPSRAGSARRGRGACESEKPAQRSTPRTSPLVGTPVPAVTTTCSTSGTWLTEVPRTSRAPSAIPFMPCR